MDRICPLIALGADRRTASTVPDPDHRCRATQPPSTLIRELQATVCLAAAHAECERLRTWRASHPDSPQASAAADVVSTRMVVEPEGRIAAAALAPVRAGGARWLVAAAALTVLAVMAFVSAGGVSALSRLVATAGSSSPGPEASATPGAAPEPSSVPLLAPSAPATPTPVAQPTRQPTPTSTSRPTLPPGTPTPAPAVAAQTYAVQPGDTLSAIAAAHGTTVAALMAANGITDADHVLVGEELVIP